MCAMQWFTRQTRVYQHEKVGEKVGENRDKGRDPFNQNFRKFRSKTEWIGSVQPEKFRKNQSTFRGGPLFSVGPVRSK